MNAPTLTRRSFTKGMGGLVLAFSLDPSELLAQGANKRDLAKKLGLKGSDRIQLKRLMVDAPSLIVACGLAMRRFDPV